MEWIPFIWCTCKSSSPLSRLLQAFVFSSCEHKRPCLIQIIHRSYAHRNKSCSIRLIWLTWCTWTILLDWLLGLEAFSRSLEIRCMLWIVAFALHVSSLFKFLKKKLYWFITLPLSVLMVMLIQHLFLFQSAKLQTFIKIHGKLKTSAWSWIKLIFCWLQISMKRNLLKLFSTIFSRLASIGWKYLSSEKLE